MYQDRVALETKPSSWRAMKAPAGQIEDQTAIHLFVESEVEVVESFLRVAELGLLFSAAPAGVRRDEASSSETRQERKSMGGRVRPEPGAGGFLARQPFRPGEVV